MTYLVKNIVWAEIGSEPAAASFTGVKRGLEDTQNSPSQKKMKEAVKSTDELYQKAIKEDRDRLRDELTLHLCRNMPTFNTSPDTGEVDLSFFIGQNFTAESSSLCCGRGIIDIQPKIFIKGLLDVTPLTDY